MSEPNGSELERVQTIVDRLNRRDESLGNLEYAFAVQVLLFDLEMRRQGGPETQGPGPEAHE